MAKPPSRRFVGGPPTPLVKPPQTLAQVLANELKQIANIEREKRQVEKRLAELNTWLREREARYGLTKPAPVKLERRPASSGRHIFTDQDLATARQLRAQGLAFHVIGERMGINGSVISRHLGGKVKRTAKKRRRFTVDQFQQAQKLHAAGMNYAEIGRRLSVASNVVSAHLNGKVGAHQDATPPNSEPDDD